MIYGLAQQGGHTWVCNIIVGLSLRVDNPSIVTYRLVPTTPTKYEINGFVGSSITDIWFG